MNKEIAGRISIPGRIIDLLLSDDEFYREVSSHKKASFSGRFPKYDQWCDEECFNMAFALAGYSASDIDISTKNSILYIASSKKSQAKSLSDLDLSDNQEGDYPIKKANIQMQHGMIVRGIARRSFRTKFFINPDYDLSRIQASMCDGLLEIKIPAKKEEELRVIPIK
tara:strand:- start:2846 stop:3349 length:504 start_codon:yes stop_codon:yes gene_type:complete